MTRIIENLGDVAHHYDCLLVDIWGCIHNGIIAFPSAIGALHKFRQNQSHVVLITNSPRLQSGVCEQLKHIGVSRDCWDDIVTSGDASWHSIHSGIWGQHIYHIGPQRDLVAFKASTQQRKNCDNTLNLVSFDDATVLVCTGLYNEDKDALVDYNQTFEAALLRNMKMLCVNPDIFINRGHKQVLCAGALAQHYSNMGGKCIYFGKPHQPIYDLAYQKIQRIKTIDKGRILAIGDGMHTDILGAHKQGIDSLFVANGVMDLQTSSKRTLDTKELNCFFDDYSVKPTYAITSLQ